MDPTSQQVVEIFSRALDVDPGGRAAYLEKACGSERGLREKVEALLEAHGKAGGFFTWAAGMFELGITTDSAVGEGPGDRVGNYKLIKQIGEGGCGIVFLAEQEEPVRREVALKVVKPGMDTRSVIARFESERQALALMEHPHIAQVLDAGATDSGRPYFVMELVRGTHITGYCDRERLTIRARLELFVQVCHAIQHAHQKGIIHRDIKPSNILVTTTAEGSPSPKVIDFGIARATTGQQLTDNTYFTAFEMLVGTPAYMSPEQAALKGGDVDTRADIYSLGVLLYELLAGMPPLEVRELFKVGLDEVRRDILDKVPTRPSQRLKAMPAEELKTAAGIRQMEPSRLIRAVSGDLDWIVMKALEKDRARRYPTANALALDVQRHLANEPVAARPPSALYQAGKLMARNRLLVGSIAVIGLLLLATLAIVSVSLARERKAHEQAEIEKHTARVEAAKSTQVSGFLSEMLTSVSPSVAMGRDTTILRDVLAQADRKIGKNLPDQPEVEGELRLMLASSYQDLGDHAAAERMLRRALELYQASEPPDRRKIATTKGRLGFNLLRQGHNDDAEPLLQSSRELWREIGAEDEREAVKTMEFFALLRSYQHRDEEAEAMMRHVHAWRKKNLKPDDPDLINALTSMAIVARGANKLSESEQLFIEALDAIRQAYGENDPSQASTLMNLYKVTSDQGKDDEARAYLSRSVLMYRKHFYPGHLARLTATLRLADLHRGLGALAEAEDLYREVKVNGGRTVDDYNPTVIAAVSGLVSTLKDQKKHAEVDAVFGEILTPEFTQSQQCVPVLKMRVELLSRAGRWSEAAAEAGKLVALRPGEHESYHMLAPLLVAAGDGESYRKLCAVILSRFATTTDKYTADRMAKDCLIRPGAVEDLAAVGRMADLALKDGRNDVSFALFQVCKALAEFRQGNHAAAAELAGKVRDTLPDARVEALAVQAMALQHMGRPDEAMKQLESGFAIFAAKLPKLESGDLGEKWRDWIIARELLDEAKRMLESEKPAG